MKHCAPAVCGAELPSRAIGRAVRRAVDAFDAKADALAVLEAAGAPVSSLQVMAGAPAWYHPGRSGTIQMGPQNKLAYFGEIHPRVLGSHGCEGTAGCL